MKDKYLGKDGITEKYDLKCNLIKCFRNIGILGGGAYAIYGVHNNNLKEMVLGGVFGLGSYVLLNYTNMRNEKKKEKALKNIETALEERK
jgi:hypothetical protein